MKTVFKLLITLILVSGISKSQNLDLNSLKLAQIEATRYENINRSTTSNFNTKDRFITDKVVNPEKYIVGPGDELHINIISSNETFDYRITISPTGHLLIPSVGMIECSKLNLTQLTEEIKRQVKSWNKNVKINVELETIRRFRVLVLGQFSNAGYFVVTPMTRLSDLLVKINSAIDKQQSNKAARTPTQTEFNDQVLVDDFYNRKLPLNERKVSLSLSKRNIIILRGMDTIFVDLEKFKISGDLNLNPYIHQDDIISVPYAKRFFTVHGGVQKPGKYEHKIGDKIFDGIMIAGGFHPDAISDSISLIRTKFPKKTESTSLTFNESKLKVLDPQDHIMIPFSSNVDPHTIVEIKGEVNYPGSYPIENGKTTIGNIIKMAGGFLPSADSSKIFINNDKVAKLPDRELERILIKNEINRSDEEKAYVKARLRTQRGSLETSLMTIVDNNHILTNDDVIFVKKYYPYIEVIGAVQSPGRYPFTSNQRPKDYIKLAGGTTHNASRKRFIIKSTTGQRIKVNRKLDLQYGDIVFVPEKKERNDMETFTMFYQALLTFFTIRSIG